MRAADYQATSTAQLEQIFGERIYSHPGCVSSSLTRKQNKHDSDGCVCCFTADVRARSGRSGDCIYDFAVVYIFALVDGDNASSTLVRDLIAAWRPQPERASLVRSETSDSVETRLWRSGQDAFEARVTRTKWADGRVLVYAVFNRYPLQ
jgi:hypothetical protein